MRRLRFIDSHTGGEPTRVLLAGVPRPPGGVHEGLADFYREHGWLLEAAVSEPRGSDILVGAVYWAPMRDGDPGELLFFNNVGLLGMCGHGTIGLVTSLAFLGELAPSRHRLDTPVGEVQAEWTAEGRVRIGNVAAFREHKDVAVEVPGHRRFVGDVAWGGNWFYIVEQSALRLDLANVDALTELAWAIRRELTARGVTGRDGARIEPVGLTAAGDETPGNDSRNFVLWPGKAYIRSPCGTGTSASLTADGKLRPCDTWRQPSITDSMFEASYELDGCDAAGPVRARLMLVGDAQVTALGELLVDERERSARLWK
ncbi:proline racemase family protein [Thiomonas sp. FB-Cd]|uniref:proline racemase family protein n=1 Tax=Thiomonas sp. FB-Cd TaxID=1158292 RepID=UPI0004DF6DF0|nr:proline racemase family protein [Thiomonas sp. FB-Cd]